MPPDLLHALLTDIEDAIQAYRMSDQVYKAAHVYADDHQLELPGSETWPLKNRMSADHDLRQALSRLIISALSHDRRSAAGAAMAVQTPRYLEGDNIVSFRKDTKHFTIDVLSRELYGLFPSPAGMRAAANLAANDIMSLGDLISPRGLRLCSDICRDEEEVEAVDDLLSRFGMRLPVRPLPAQARVR